MRYREGARESAQQVKALLESLEIGGSLTPGNHVNAGEKELHKVAF